MKLKRHKWAAFMVLFFVVLVMQHQNCGEQGGESGFTLPSVSKGSNGYFLQFPASSISIASSQNSFNASGLCAASGALTNSINWQFQQANTSNIITSGSVSCNASAFTAAVTGLNLSAGSYVLTATIIGYNSKSAEIGRSAPTTLQVTVTSGSGGPSPGPTPPPPPPPPPPASDCPTVCEVDINSRCTVQVKACMNCCGTGNTHDMFHACCP